MCSVKVAVSQIDVEYLALLHSNIISFMNTYDFVVCTEVFEHTSQPFDAIDEIWRI